MSSNVKTVNVALCGAGIVGGGVCQIIKERQEVFKTLGIQFNIKTILVRNVSKKRDFELPAGAKLTDNVEDIFSDDSIDLIVEVMGGLGAAKTVVFGGLKAKKSVVTANKALISYHLNELEELVNTFSKDGSRFAFEAAVGGGIPVIKSLQRDIIGADDVMQVSGILNGTTNYMLTKMDQTGCSYEAALKEAQDLGFAEADPTADVEGHDARSKISLLCRLTLGVWIKDEDISCTGISTLTADDFEYAKILKSKIKLLGICKKVNNGTGAEIYVSPVIVPISNTISSTNGATNIVEVRSKYLGTTYYVGAGAGRFPTATSIVGDMLEISLNKSPKPFPLKQNLTQHTDYPGRFYIRINIRDATGIIRTVGAICENEGVSIHSVLQIPITDKQNVPFVITTDETLASKVKVVVDSLEKQPWCLKRPVALPFL
jgi:homoserine dehydrogenase